MRLLNTRTLEFSRVYFPSTVPDYVILSHRWGPDEVTYADIIQAPLSETTSVTRNKHGFLKIQGACQLALRNGYEWIWIDSCCIDKSSSAELQGAINSMWRYYKESNICFVYMEDVADAEAGWGSDQLIGKSKWFTRGWTLQELIAPTSVEFYATKWQSIGTKLERYQEIAEITGIDRKVLCNEIHISSFSTAEKLSWAAHRQVTREEDEAYSLFGLFDVNMPLLYGEGRLKAFMRLQEAIYDTTSDHTGFLFLHSRNGGDGHPLLAESPSQFCDRKTCKFCSIQTLENYSRYFSYADLVDSESWQTQAHDKFMTTVTMQRNEVLVVLSLLDYADVRDKLSYFDDTETHDSFTTHVALLNYTVSTHKKGGLCLLLRRRPGHDATMRLQILPALLPCVEDRTARQLKKTRVLICRPGSIRRESTWDTETTFSFDSGSFCIGSWHPPGMNIVKHDTQGGTGETERPSQAENNERFQVQTQSSRLMVEWKLVDIQDRKLFIRLMLANGIWSIDEVKKKGRRVAQNLRTFYKANKPTDRCAVSLPDGERIVVKLRPLPAFARGHANGQISTLRYMISVESDVK